jgi:hypothetical protein
LARRRWRRLHARDVAGAATITVALAALGCNPRGDAALDAHTAVPAPTAPPSVDSGPPVLGLDLESGIEPPLPPPLVHGANDPPPVERAPFSE